LTLTPEQIRALLGVLAEPFRTMVLLALLSGLRRGEIFGLRWKSVDWLEGSIVVIEADYEGQAFSSTKNAYLLSQGIRGRNCDREFGTSPSKDIPT
jgi:integrase